MQNRSRLSNRTEFCKKLLMLQPSLDLQDDIAEFSNFFKIRQIFVHVQFRTVQKFDSQAEKSVETLPRKNCANVGSATRKRELEKCANILKLEKSCKTKHHLQKSASIQPRTSSPNLGKSAGQIHFKR